MEAVRVVVSGRVQGVGYRAFLMAEAERLGLQGWVRNRVDGTVEALVGGPGEAIHRLIAACQRGPRLAQVAAVKVQPEPPGVVPNGFSVRPTA